MPKVIGIVGDRNEGKTLKMTKHLYEDYLNGYKIVANYHLNFPHTYMETHELVECFKNDDEQLNNTTIGIDELLIGADARRPGAKDNQELSYLLVQVRKRNIDFYYTVQKLWYVDIRLRAESDMLIIMSNMSNPIMDIETGKPLRDSQGRVIYEELIFKSIIVDPKTFKQIGHENIFSPTLKLLKLYDTKEIIKKGE